MWWDTFVQGLTPRYLFRPTAENLIISFYSPPVLSQYKARVAPPILRDSVLALNPRDDGHVLVYQSNSTHRKLVDFLRAATRKTCYVFGYDRTDGQEDNVIFMAERKSGFRQALSALPAQEEALLRAQEDLSRELSRLGPDWSCDRIRATDRSLFAREDIERQGREMRAAASAHQAAVDSLTQSNREVESAEREVASNTAALDLLPAPPAALDDDARDNLRQALARQEEARRQRPLRQRAVNEAKTTFSRAFNPLRLVVNGASDGAQAETLLDSLLSRQEEALALAADVQGKMRQADDAAQDVRQAEEQVAAVKGRVEALREEQRHINGPTREDLDGQTLALRKLRALSATLGTERERLEELSARIGNEPPVTRVKNLPLLVLGLAFFLGGAGMPDNADGPSAQRARDRFFCNGGGHDGREQVHPVGRPVQKDAQNLCIHSGGRAFHFGLSPVQRFCDQGHDRCRRI